MVHPEAVQHEQARQQGVQELFKKSAELDQTWQYTSSILASALQVTERSEKDLPHLQVDWRKLAQHAYFSKTQGVDENPLGKVVLWHALAAESMWLTFMRRSEAFNEEHREFYKLEMQFCESYIVIIAHAIVSGRCIDERIHDRLAFVNGMLLTAS